MKQLLHSVFGTDLLVVFMKKEKKDQLVHFYEEAEARKKKVSKQRVADCTLIEFPASVSSLFPPSHLCLLT